MSDSRVNPLALAALAVALIVVGVVADRLPWPADLRIMLQRVPSQFPSSQAVPQAELARGGAVLSIYTQTDNLHDPDTGLLTNTTEVGREWERPATISFFEDGRLDFASSVGLRVHGGKSRTGSPVMSFRLYFRRKYGSVQFRPGRLFNGVGDPLTRLVVHNDLRADRDGEWWHLVNPLAFDIARQVGALAPATQPASVVLNGEPLGLYVLTEHVRRPFLISRFGHDDFDRATEQQRTRWMRDVTRRPSFTMADASAWLDVESLTRWFVSVAFSATTDAFQAVMFRDRTQPDARWLWVNWDMDHSFMDLYADASSPARQDSFRETLRQRAFESRVLRRLIEEDSEYRRYLADIFLDALNYQLTPSFLDERFRHYRETAERFGLGDARYLDVLEGFLEARPAFVRRLLVRHLDLEPLQPVQVESPATAVVRVNGHVVGSSFIGWYLPGTEVRVGLEAPHDEFSHWSVNGLRVDRPEIWHQVRARTMISAERMP